jgi:hypothetical protein
MLVFRHDGEKQMQAYHSLQNRKVICSTFFFGSSPYPDSGDAIVRVGWFGI